MSLRARSFIDVDSPFDSLRAKLVVSELDANARPGETEDSIPEGTFCGDDAPLPPGTFHRGDERVDERDDVLPLCTLTPRREVGPKYHPLMS